MVDLSLSPTNSRGRLAVRRGSGRSRVITAAAATTTRVERHLFGTPPWYLLVFITFIVWYVMASNFIGEPVVNVDEMSLLNIPIISTDQQQQQNTTRVRTKPYVRNGDNLEGIIADVATEQRDATANENDQGVVKEETTTVTSYSPRGSKQQQPEQPENYDEYGWPLKVPREIFGPDKFDSCRVVFKDKNMSACHLGGFGGNFGDMLGPDVVKRAVEYHFGCSAHDLPVHDFYYDDDPATSYPGICLMSVGSVWRFVSSNDHVWGTGTLGGLKGKGTKCREFHKLKNVTAYSVRGPKTVSTLQQCWKRKKTKIFVYSKTSSVDGDGGGDGGVTSRDFSKLPTAGDGGYLIPFLFPELLKSKTKPAADTTEKKSSSLCIILHKNDEEVVDLNFTTTTADFTFLPVMQSWKTTVRTMTTNCRMVSSSSLHGLIVADALGIPATWIRGDESNRVNKFKFFDYFESYNVTKQKYKLRDFLAMIADDTFPVPTVQPLEYRSAYARRILDSFPYHLFTRDEVY